MKYFIIIEKAGDNFSAFVPDLPGCIAAADTFEETERLIREGINISIEELRADGQPIPQPTTRAAEIDVPFSA